MNVLDNGPFDYEDFVYHNIDGNGRPTQFGGVVGLSEVDRPFQLRRYFAKKNMKMRKAGKNVAALDGRYSILETHKIRLHRSGAFYKRRHFSPTRYLLLIVAYDKLRDKEIVIAVTHLIDSAFEHGADALRMQLWKQSARTIERVLTLHHEHGRSIVLMLDANAGPRDIAQELGLKPFMRDIAMPHKGEPRLDRILATKDITPIEVTTGAHTGNGRHTHPSLRVRAKLN